MSTVLRSKCRRLPLLFVICLLVVAAYGTATAEEGGDGKTSGKVTVGSTDSATDTPLPDIFTGTMSYRIPIVVPPGRTAKGMEPGITLTYRSTNGNDWLGVGWELVMGSIERSTRKGVNYNGNEFVLRTPGGTSELVSVGTDTYQAKIEGNFIKAINRGTYWEATDKNGIRFRFGYDESARLYDFDNPTTRVFKWCLDRITDTSDNYISLSYSRNESGSAPRTQQIYLSQIDYTGGANLNPTNSVKFILQDRSDAPVIYTTGFAVKTAKRLQAIEVWSNSGSKLVRKYQLAYDASPSAGEQYSPISERSMLSSVTEYGSDGTTAKPPIAFQYSNGYPVSSGWYKTHWSGSYPGLPVTGRCFSGDVDGNGMHNAACYSGSNGVWDIEWAVKVSEWGLGMGTYTATLGINPTYNLWEQCITGDFNGEGKIGIACNISNNGSWSMAFSTGIADWSTDTWINGPIPTPPFKQCFAGDFDGNGISDFACYIGDKWKMALSDGTGWGSGSGQWSSGPGPDPAASCTTGDFDGNGKTDFACYAGNRSWTIWSPDGTSWSPSTWSYGLNAPTPSETSPLSSNCITGDFNGDGKTDVACYLNNIWSVALSTGGGWDTPSFNGAASSSIGSRSACVPGDFNGDGKTDIGCYTSAGNWNVALSTGSAWNTSVWADGPSPSDTSRSISQQCLAGDYSGDGKTDISCYSGTTTSGSWDTGRPAAGPFADLLTSVSNGLGNVVSIEYTTSSSGVSGAFGRVPYPLYLVETVAVSDGNGNNSRTSYRYNRGYFYAPERDFRGFNTVTTSGPTGPNGEQLITTTWFHQGNDTTVISEDKTPDELYALAKVATGYMKGKPYRTRVADAGGNIYSETETTYRSTPAPNPHSYYFNPPQRVDTYICDGSAIGVCKGTSGARHTYTEYTYDDYGNVTREYRYGDPGNPPTYSNVNLTIARSYLHNADSWLMGALHTESIFNGIGDTDTPEHPMVSQTKYYYDQLFDCNTDPTLNLPPTPTITKGNVTRIIRWFKDGTDIGTGMAYDGYGNLACVRDPNGNITASGFDPVFNSFRTSSINAKNQTTGFTFYGINATADNGSFGLLKSVTDPNNATVTTQYDIFGRKKFETQPDNFWTRTTYNNFGTLDTTTGSQHIKADNQYGMWAASYFDGLGRTFKTRKSGPDNKIIATDTEYDARGNISRKSLPYFEGLQTAFYRTYAYDALGRVTQATNPDGTKTMTCYSDLVTVFIDENYHRRRETHDALGRLVTVEEYKGVYPTCSTAQVDQCQGPYATTSYSYDALGNLTHVSDIRGNVTDIQYDSLGRKLSMTDPDMGNWSYTYYPDGSVHTVTDSIAQTTTFTYDSLNRVRTKQYPKPGGTGTVTYNYDEAASAYPVGRLTSMLDESGSTRWSYDQSGRPATITKTVDAVAYPISRLYDGLGRVTRITYPDNAAVDYRYDLGGNLSEAVYFAQFIDYNASGQPGAISYANGATTWFQYNPLNSRLIGLENDSPDWILDSFGYLYDNKGNLTQITSGYTLYNDLIPSTTDYYSAGHNIYYSSKNIPSTDATIVNQYYPNGTGNGNPGRISTITLYGTTIEFINARLITYNTDNMPLSITTNASQPSQSTTSFVYDGNNKRVKKISPTHTRLYIDKLYECVDNACGKFIFAGNTRIASVHTGQTYYYQPDHQGSTSSITDTNGEWVESIAYYPFGETRQEYLGGTGAFTHKYTGQELDDETGLYNYGARLYDPAVGRFLTPDSIVPDYANPQSLNRYAYVLNNPLRYIDPTGHYSEEASFDFDFDFDFDFEIGAGSYSSGFGSGSGYGYDNAYGQIVDSVLASSTNFGSGIGFDSQSVNTLISNTSSNIDVARADVYAWPRTGGGFEYIAADDMGSEQLTGTFNTGTAVNLNQLPAGDYTVSPRPSLPEPGPLGQIRDFFFGDRNRNVANPTISNTSNWNQVLFPDGKLREGIQIHPGRRGTDGGASRGCLVCTQGQFNQLNQMFWKNYNNGGVNLHIFPSAP